MTATKGKQFWIGKAPRPELMSRPAPGEAMQGKPRSFWDGKAPRPDLMPGANAGAAVQARRRSGALQRSQLARPKWDPPLAVGIGNEWLFERVVSEQDLVNYKCYLTAWGDSAKKKIDVELYETQRSEISEKVCTPLGWTKAEETACVCDDLIDALEEADDEVQYVISYKTDEATYPIGAITLRDGYHLVKTEPRDEGFNITGLIKGLDIPVSFATCIPKFLSVILKKTGKRGIDVASAIGALVAYGKYGFQNTKTDAGHYGHKCGCTVLLFKQ